MYQLEDLSPENLSELLPFRNGVDFIQTCINNNSTVTLDEWKKELEDDFRRGRHRQLLLRHNGITVGTIWTYNFTESDGYIFISLFLASSHRRRGLGSYVTSIVLFHLFDLYPCLFKIYCDVYGHNHQAMQALESAGFCCEGRFRNQRSLADRRVDVLRYALYRTDLAHLEVIRRRAERVIGPVPRLSNSE
jgi:RimJ/RimL family protein N-acetyltransferase